MYDTKEELEDFKEYIVTKEEVEIDSSIRKLKEAHLAAHDFGRVLPYKYLSLSELIDEYEDLLTPDQAKQLRDKIDNG